jgi:hypothetical protein
MTKTQQRAVLYLVIAIAAPLHDGISSIHSVRDAVILALAVLLSAANTLRAFIDTTPGDEKKALPSGETGVSPQATPELSTQEKTETKTS